MFRFDDRAGCQRGENDLCRDMPAVDIPVGPVPLGHRPAGGGIVLQSVNGQIFGLLRAVGIIAVLPQAPIRHRLDPFRAAGQS